MNTVFSQSAYGIKYEKLKYHSLHHAVHDTRIPQIELLLKLHPELINLRTDLGLTPLMIACCLPASVRKDKIIWMLTKSSMLHPYETDACQRSAIFYLVNFSTLSQLKSFLERTKFNYMDETDNDGYTILHYAAIKEDLGMVEFIIDLFKRYKISINIASLANYSPLLLACRLKRLKSAALIIKMGGTGFNIRDNEHFRNCAEWIECNDDGNSGRTNKDHFYFNRFEMNSTNSLGNLMKIGIESISARHIDCFSLTERSQTSISSDYNRDCFGLTDRQNVSQGNERYYFLSSNHAKSSQVQELESMSDDEIREYILDALKSGSKKLNRPKRVSIIVKEKVYLPRNSIDSSVTTNKLPYCRQSSATIAHHLLNKLPMECYYYL